MGSTLARQPAVGPTRLLAPARFEQLVILFVSTNPNPDQAVFIFACKSTMVSVDASRPKGADLLEVQGRVLGIAPEQIIVLAGRCLNIFRKRIEQVPEP